MYIYSILYLRENYLYVYPRDILNLHYMNSIFTQYLGYKYLLWNWPLIVYIVYFSKKKKIIIYYLTLICYEFLKVITIVTGSIIIFPRSHKSIVCGVNLRRLTPPNSKKKSRSWGHEYTIGWQTAIGYLFLYKLT